MMAVSVIVWHSFSLTGRDIDFAPVQRLIGDGGVDGFFAISGFLITASWLSKPKLRSYFIARGLRILPGLWVCLAVTALVIAPISVAIQGGSAMKLLTSAEPYEYILANSGVQTLKPDIAGTPTGVPFPHSWNGSLWTLFFELQCYIAIAVFGLLGLLRRRWFIPVVLAFALFWSALLPPPLPMHTDALTFWELVARFAVMFYSGALLYQFRDSIPARWSLVALSVLIVLAASLMPNYRIIGGIALAYAVIVSGALIHDARFTLRTDLSYGVYIYAFPIQQLLIICGLVTLNPLVFAVIATAATMPLAAFSWFLIEKPATSLKTRLTQRRVDPLGEELDERDDKKDPSVGGVT